MSYYKDDEGDTGVNIFCCGSDGNNSVVFIDSIPARKTETSTQVPEYLSQYVAPTQLGDDITLGIFKLEGKMYQLPAPVGEFIDAGWQITQKPNFITALGRGDIKMERNGVKIELTVRNSDFLQTIPENCEAISITVDSSCEIPGGFYIGMPLQDADNIAGKYFSASERIETDIAVRYDMYIFNTDYVITIDVDKATGLNMIRINVSYI